MKLWDKGTTVHPNIDRFTVGRDREFDLHLARYDVLGSLAHATMLGKIGLLTQEETEQLLAGLREVYSEIENGNFVIDDSVEDVHSQVELLLTQRLGETGKKIHTGRSRNDQVLVDIRLFLRDRLWETIQLVHSLFELLLEQSERYRDVLLPGYTHLQIAMPSSFGLWFGAYAESLVDDVIMLNAAWRIVNKNPLGSAAGYGSSFPLDRTETTHLLGFETLNYNVVYAQMGRGKTERITAQALSSVAATLAKMAMDICLYMSQNFGFVAFPDELTTGSSIMPHKKNPDVFELIRGRCNRLQAVPNDIALFTTNLPSGYHRDLQLLKEALFPAFDELHSCLAMMRFALESIRVKENILDDERYTHLFSVDAVHEKVRRGLSFRDAYREVGLEIAAGTSYRPATMEHTHEGSIGNLCTEDIRSLMQQELDRFAFGEVDAALSHLL
jgi:argininosuccinate lyase